MSPVRAPALWDGLRIADDLLADVVAEFDRAAPPRPHPGGGRLTPDTGTGHGGKIRHIGLSEVDAARIEGHPVPGAAPAGERH